MSSCMLPVCDSHLVQCQGQLSGAESPGPLWEPKYVHMQQEGFDWLKVPCKMTKVILPMCAADVDRKFNMFGISMKTELGSSGIAWSECVYVERKIPGKMSDVKLADNSPDLSLTVTWANAWCANRVLINGYFIDYCQFNTETENCEEPDQSERVEETENSYTIRGLMAGVTYSVKVKSSSTGGNGSQSDPVFGVPVDTSLQTGQIVGIVIGSFFVVVLIVAGIIWFLRCCRRGLCKRMKITLPEIPEKYLINDMENKPKYTKTGENVKDDAKIFKTQISNNDSGHGSMRSNSVGETSNKEAGDSPHSPTIAEVPKQDKDSSDSVKERKNTGFGLREGHPVDYSKFTTAESLSDACIPEPAIKQNNTHVVGFVQGSENPSFNMQGLQSSEEEHTSSDMTGVKVNGTDGFSDYSAEGSDISPYVTAVDQNTQSGLTDTDTSDDETPYIHGRESSGEDLNIPAISNAQTPSSIHISQAPSTTEDVKDESTNHTTPAAISPDIANNLLQSPALMPIPDAASREPQFVTTSSADKNSSDKMPNFHQVESYTHASNVEDRGYVPLSYTENSESGVVSRTPCSLPLSAKEGDTDPSYVTEVDLPLLRLTEEVLPVSASENLTDTKQVPVPLPTVDSDGSSFARSNNNPTLQVAVASEISGGVNPETDVNTYMPIKMANTEQSNNDSTENKDHGWRMQTLVHPDYI